MTIRATLFIDISIREELVMKTGIVLPTNEMRADMPSYNGPLVEETAPNPLTSKRISQMAHDAVFKYQPEFLMKGGD
ncbi:MAG: hypothetical protein Q7K40_00290 [bacterium]|nr:hypothetical protein [bacterium]